MEKPQPGTPRISAQIESFANLPAKLRKNNVHADDIGVEAIHARGIDGVGNYATKVAISPPAQMICEEPPNIAKKMRPWRDIYSMPGDIPEVYALDNLAVKMNFVILGKSLDLFGHASFGSVILIERWRNHRQPWSTPGRRHGQ